MREWGLVDSRRSPSAKAVLPRFSSGLWSESDLKRLNAQIKGLLSLCLKDDCAQYSSAVNSILVNSEDKANLDFCIPKNLLNLFFQLIQQIQRLNRRQVV